MKSDCYKETYQTVISLQKKKKSKIASLILQNSDLPGLYI